MIQEMDHNKDGPFDIIPTDLKGYLDNFKDENGCCRKEELKAEQMRLRNHEEELIDLMKERIEKMLDVIDLEKVDANASSPLEEYLDALSVNRNTAKKDTAFIIKEM